MYQLFYMALIWVIFVLTVVMLILCRDRAAARRIAALAGIFGLIFAPQIAIGAWTALKVVLLTVVIVLGLRLMFKAITVR